jgi:hypothetical protein
MACPVPELGNRLLKVDHFGPPAHYYGMLTLPRFIALALLGAFSVACSSRDTLLKGGAAGATGGAADTAMGGSVSRGGGGAATTGGKAGDASQQQGASGTPPTGDNAAAGDAGGLVETGGMPNETTGGAGGATGGAAPSGLPEGCVPCSKLTTLNDCTAQTNCHPVFVDPHDCRCSAIGCCAHFSGCVDGAQADCALPEQFSCTIAMPFCDSPAYVNAYKNGCYDGCVASANCAP